MRFSLPCCVWSVCVCMFVFRTETMTTTSNYSMCNVHCRCLVFWGIKTYVFTKYIHHTYTCYNGNNNFPCQWHPKNVQYLSFYSHFDIIIVWCCNALHMVACNIDHIFLTTPKASYLSDESYHIFNLKRVEPMKLKFSWNYWHIRGTSLSFKLVFR